MKSILVGCPVYKREWILPLWLSCLEKQNYPKEDIGLVFELGPDDDETHDLLWQFQVDHPEYKSFDAQVLMTIAHDVHPDGHRVWSTQRYFNMVTLRNNLLERATALADKFDFYFSLDSDILLEDPDTLNKLVAHSEEYPDFGVYSPLMYMTPHDTDYPSAMSWMEQAGSRAARIRDNYKVNEVFEADIVMAAVFMRKEVFTTVRYRYHRQGEDLGFALNLFDANFKSLATWDIYCPHIMHKENLDEYIKSGHDFRKPVECI